MAKPLTSLLILNMLALVANFSFAAVPVFLGAYVDVLGLSLAEAGRIASFETMGNALGIIAMAMGMTSPAMKIRQVAGGSLAILAAAQIASALVDGTAGLAIARAVSGFAAGLAYSAGNVYISGLAKPDRPFAIYYGMLFVAGPLGLAIVPALLPLMGLKGVFFAYAAILLLSLFLLPLYPPQRSPADAAPATMPQRSSVRASLSMYILLGALFINFIFNGGVWIYAERIGARTGASPETLGLLLSLAMLSGLIGTAIVSVLGARLGRLAPITATHFALMLVMFLFYQEPGLLTFFAAVALFNIAITAMTPYALALLAAADNTGRMAVLGTATFSLGYGLGPAALSFLLQDGDFKMSFVVAGAGFGVSLALVWVSFYLLARMGRRALPASG